MDCDLTTLDMVMLCVAAVLLSAFLALRFIFYPRELRRREFIEQEYRRLRGFRFSECGMVFGEQAIVVNCGDWHKPNQEPWPETGIAPYTAIVCPHCNMFQLYDKEGTSSATPATLFDPSVFDDDDPP